MNNSRNKNIYLFEEAPVSRAVMTMAIPTIIAQLIILIYNMADTFFIGRANNPSMVAAASLILPIYNVSIAFANVAGTGGGTLIARLLGRGDNGEARRVAAFSFYFSMVAGLLFSFLTLAFMEPLLKILGASPETYGYARQYAFCVIVIGAAPTVLTMTMGNLLRSVGCARQAGIGTSLGGIINIFLDPLFMFVILPPGQEILGAGIATALSNFIACAFFIIVILRLDDPILRLAPRDIIPMRAQIASFFAVGLPAALGPFLFDLDYIVIDKFMAGYSDTALAAMGIVLKVERLPLNIGIGLCLGMVPLAAYNFSIGKFERMDNILGFTRRTGVVVSVISIVLYELLATPFIRIFLEDTATVTYGASFLRIRALATIMMFLSFIYVHFFQAVGKGKYSLFLTVFRWLIVNIPMLFILNAIFGMYGVVWSQFVADCIVALVSWLVFRSFRRRSVLVDVK